MFLHSDDPPPQLHPLPPLQQVVVVVVVVVVVMGMGMGMGRFNLLRRANLLRIGGTLEPPPPNRLSP